MANITQEDETLLRNFVKCRFNTLPTQWIYEHASGLGFDFRPALLPTVELAGARSAVKDTLTLSAKIVEGEDRYNAVYLSKNVRDAIQTPVCTYAGVRYCCTLVTSVQAEPFMKMLRSRKGMLGEVDHDLDYLCHMTFSVRYESLRTADYQPDTLERLMGYLGPDDCKSLTDVFPEVGGGSYGRSGRRVAKRRMW